MSGSAASRPGGQLYGFAARDWVAAGAFRDEQTVADWVEAEPPAEFSREAWLALARLSPEHARLVLALVGEPWSQWAEARRARGAGETDPDLRRDFGHWASELEAQLAELRSLARR